MRIYEKKTFIEKLFACIIRKNTYEGVLVMSATNNKSLTPGYSLIQGCYWMIFGTLMGYSSFFLLAEGFSNTQIGMLVAAACILSVIVQPMAASYADQPGSISVKKIILLLFMCQLILGIGLIFSKTNILTGVLYGSSIMLLQLASPFINALGMESINQGKKLDFGFARGMGSVAFAVISYILGIVTNKAGESIIPIFIVILALAMIGCAAVFPFTKTEIRIQNISENRSSVNPVKFFMRYRRFALVLIGCVFLYLSHVLQNNFLFQISQYKGGGSAEMGTASAIAAMAELPTLFLFGYVIKKFRCDILLKVSGVFFTVKAVGTLLSPSVPVFYSVQIFQMLGWGLITAASVYYVNMIMEPEDAIKGQAYFTMAYTLGNVLASMLGGVIIDAAGVKTMLIIASAAAALGAVIVSASAEKTPIKEKACSDQQA